MKIGNRAILMALAGGLMCTAPAMADDDRRGWRGDDRREWREDRREWRDERRDERRAYDQGFRDGQRAGRGGSWDDRRWNNAGWNDGQWNRGWQGDGWNGQPARGIPVSSAGWQQGRDYWFDNGRYRCRRPDGTVGVVVGAVAGGTLGNVLAGQGDKRLGSIIGGTLGAIVGREVARGNARCR